MTIVLSICAVIDFLVILVGVPSVLWRKKPEGALGLIWWICVTLLLAIFSVASLVAAFGLATSTSTAGHLILFLGVLSILWMFFTLRAPDHA